MDPDKLPTPPDVRQILLWLATRTVALEFVQAALRGGNLEAVRVSAEVALATGPDFALLLQWINGGAPAEQFAAEVEKSRAAGAAARAGTTELFGFPVVVSPHAPPGKIAFVPASVAEGPSVATEIDARCRCVDPVPLKTMRTAWGYPLDQPPPASFPSTMATEQFPAVLQAIKRHRHEFVFPVLMHPEWIARFPELKNWPEVVQPLPASGKGEA